MVSAYSCLLLALDGWHIMGLPIKACCCGLGIAILDRRLTLIKTTSIKNNSKRDVGIYLSICEI